MKYFKINKGNKKLKALSFEVPAHQGCLFGAISYRVKAKAQALEFHLHDLLGASRAPRRMDFDTEGTEKIFLRMFLTISANVSETYLEQKVRGRHRPLTYGPLK